MSVYGSLIVYAPGGRFSGNRPSSTQFTNPLANLQGSTPFAAYKPTPASKGERTSILSHFAAGATRVAVDSTALMRVGDSITIALDTGSSHTTRVASVDGNVVGLVSPLPSSTSRAAAVINNSLKERGGKAQPPKPTAPTTGLSAAAKKADGHLDVVSAKGIKAGDAIEVRLADGSLFRTKVASVARSTEMSAGAAENTRHITLARSEGFAKGDAIEIRLGTGAVFRTTVASIVGDLVTTADALPAAALIGGTVTVPGKVRLTLATALPADAALGAVVRSAEPLVANAPKMLTDALAGDRILTVASARGMHDGDAVELAPPKSQTFRSQIAEIRGSTVLTVAGRSGQSSIVASSSLGFQAGTAVSLQLDDGTLFKTTVTSVQGTRIQLANALPADSSAGSALEAGQVSIFLGKALTVTAPKGSTLVDLEVPVPKQTTAAAKYDADTRSDHVTIGEVSGEIRYGDRIRIALANDRFHETIVTRVSGDVVYLAEKLPAAAYKGAAITVTRPDTTVGIIGSNRDNTSLSRLLGF